jgi:TolB-like protein/Tfp pilus assembly protein PilF
MEPKITISLLKKLVSYPEIVYDGLRKAGLPEDEGPRLSIVVLPFSNLSGDASQDYLADVLTDELTTYISRIPDSFVIARNTAFTYKGKPTDVKQIGKDLGVRYALEGSVQPTDKRIRTNAQLIDTETGAHLWAEEFDTDKTDLLQTEDEIVTRLARTLDIQLTAVEAAKGARARPDNPDAQDLALRCLANFNANVVVYDPKKVESLDEPCESALRFDSRNPIALRLLAIRHAQKAYRGTSANPQEDIQRADELIEAASANGPDDSDAHAAKASVLFAKGRMEDAATEAQRAIELNPSNIYAYGELCASEVAAVQPEPAIACTDRAMRLSPHDPLLYLFFDYKANSLSMLGKHDDAILWYRRALPFAPTSVQTLRGLAGALAHQGQLTEAHEMYQRALSIPGMQFKTLAQYRAYLSRVYPSNAPAVVAYRGSVEEDMRKAGMPEQ